MVILTILFSNISCSSSDNSSNNSSDEIYCLISSQGGFDDKSFNQSAKKGLDQAAEELGIQTMSIESMNTEDYQPNIETAISQGCTFVITVGWDAAEVTQLQAEQNSQIKFAIIDDSSITLENVKPMVFNTAEAAYIAGFLSAGYSTTKTIATFGAEAQPPVQLFSDGFYQGAKAYEESHSQSITVLGYDNQDPSKYMVIGGDDPYTDQSKAKQISDAFIDQGADVILPVAAAAGLGTAQACQEKGCTFLWVDEDGYETTDSTYVTNLLTSVIKNISAAVVEVIKTDVENTYNGTAFFNPYIGTIKNNGVGIAPFHDLDSKISDELKQEIETLTNEISSGSLTITSPYSP